MKYFIKNHYEIYNQGPYTADELLALMLELSYHDAIDIIVQKEDGNSYTMFCITDGGIHDEKHSGLKEVRNRQR